MAVFRRSRALIREDAHLRGFSGLGTMNHACIMTYLSDRISFLAREPRVDVAVLCQTEPRSRGEIAQALGRAPGGLTSHDTMVSAGALESTGFRPSGGSKPGGELLRLSPDWEPALREVLRRRTPSVLPEGADVVLISTGDAVRACTVIAGHGDRLPWGAVLRGEQMAMLVCPSEEPANEPATLKLLGALAAAGVTAVRLHVSRMLSESALREWAEEVAAGPGPPVLPPPRRAV